MTIADTQIPPWYKLTELWVIPVDWEVKRIWEIAPLQRWFDLTNSSLLNWSYPVVYSNWICNYHKSYMVKWPWVVTGRSGTLWKVHYILDNYRPHNTSLWVTNFNNNDPLFIFYFYKSINLLNFGTWSWVPTLNRNDVHEYKAVIPPKKEQILIATALSDIDNLITELDMLIVKKKSIKQWTMQLLLTGKKRLPGFSGEWETKKLGEIWQVTGAGIDKKINENEEPVRLLNYLDVYKKDFIYSRDLNHWVTAPRTKIYQCWVNKGDVFFTPSSELQNDIAHSAISMEDIIKATYSYHIIRLRIEDDWDLIFKTYIFKTSLFYQQAEKFAEGSGKRYVISLRRFREFEVYYPKSKEEQRAISQVIYDIDQEITSLHSKKAKYTHIKQGMMQQLLTGIIRLV